METVAQINNSTERQANIDAIATANLTAVVMSLNRYLGGDGPPEKLGELLPFKKQFERGIGADKGLAVSPETARCFFRLLAARKLPDWVVGELLQYHDEWRKLADR